MSKEAGRASQQPATRRSSSDVLPEISVMSKLLLRTLALQTRTTTRIQLQQRKKTWTRQNCCPAPGPSSKGGHHGALPARAQAAEVSRQGENLGDF